MTTDLPARVAELEKAIERIADHAENSTRNGTAAMRSTLDDIVSFAKDALTGTGDDVLAVLEEARTIISAASGLTLPPNIEIDFAGTLKRIDNVLFPMSPATPTDGWIEWKGGECPVAPETLVDIKYRDGYYGGLGGKRAVDLEWHHRPERFRGGTDIIAFKLAGEGGL